MVDHISDEYSDIMSESEGNDEELLILTRQRRSNAGNKMKRLLQQELEEMNSKVEHMNDDDLDLLFQEDADDEEFEEAETFSEPDDDEENVRDYASKKGTEPHVDITANAENDDMILSDSEDDSTEQDDDDAGERELLKEKALERKKQKRRTAPVIKRSSNIRPTDRHNQSQKRPAHEALNAESLLVSERRTSKRKSVVANKLEIYEKLSRAEKKRKIIQERIKKQKEQQKEELLTQEDRMRIALETEKFNLLSLNKYKEQEVSKKQTRLAMQKRQKIKFSPGELVVQVVSTAWKVDPIMELEDKQYWDGQVKKREKKKKKYPRRQKKRTLDPSNKNDELTEKSDGKMPVSTHAPSTSKNYTENGILPNPLIQEAVPASSPKEESSSLITKQEVKEGNETIINTKDRDVAPEIDLRGQIETSLRGEPTLDNHQDTKPSPQDPLNINSDESPDALETSTLESKQGNSTRMDLEQEIEDNQKHEVNNDLSEKDIKEKDAERTEESVSGEMKQVTFAEEPTVAFVSSDNTHSEVKSTLRLSESIENHVENTQLPDLLTDIGSEEESVFEGPPQLVAKNFVSLYKFPADPYSGDICDELFGKQWSNATRQRVLPAENICKITMPQGAVESKIETSLVPDLSFLDNFPGFGEYGKKIVHDTGANDQKELEIEIKTQPPTGVLFSNGVRKRCLITNKECQYFDPKNGVPYSDVEAYRIIQEIQDSAVSNPENDIKPRYQWFGFRNGGIYLDILQRPAKNVPEGF